MRQTEQGEHGGEGPDLTTGQLARRAGVNRTTVARWCESGRITGAGRTLGGQWRIPASEAARVLRELNPEGTIEQ
jgi:excisionase family DNA binding protein